MMYVLKANGCPIEIYYELSDAMAACADRTEAEEKIAGYVATYYTIDKVERPGKVHPFLVYWEK